MDRREKYGVLCGLLMAVSALLFLFLHGGGVKRYDYVFPIMGTRGGLSIYSRKPPEDACRAAMAAIRKVNSICSRFDPESELSRLNRSAADAPFVCSDMLWEVLTHARKAHHLSGGAFDITIEPLMKLWGFYRREKPNKIPSAAEIAEAGKLVGLDKALFDEERKSVFFTVSGMTFDLGGIAKGYAADRAAAVLEARGIRRGTVDIGGNLRFLSLPPDGAAGYRVGIRHPGKRDELVKKRLLVNGGSAVATSGDYERFVILQGKRFGHLIDPVTGIPPAPEYAVTVVAPDAVTADWLSSAGFLRGTGFARRMEEILPGVKFCFISSSDGESAEF